ncbi:MAG: radical SAM protein [Campylobacterales bacterium]|nr:radical SAM protein [Campylobacterales bacterium]
MKCVFGPIISRRFGISLGIDLSPTKKCCNFDCLYCELPKAKTTDTIENHLSVDEIIQNVEDVLKQDLKIDVITITANGEPTLYPYLDELIDRLNQIKKDKKLLILSNGSTINDKNIQKALSKLDIVKLSLDCVSENCFRKIDRSLKNILITDIINGLIEFRKMFQKELVIEILVVKSINDKDEEFLKFNEVLNKINPNRIDLGTIDRPPAYNVESVTFEKLFELSKLIQNQNINIVSRKKTTPLNKSYSNSEIFYTLANRPLTIDDVEYLFDSESKERFEQLVSSEKIEKINIGGVLFYTFKDKS